MVELPADTSHEFQIHVSVRILTIKINQRARVNFCSYRKTVFRKRWRSNNHVINPNSKAFLPSIISAFSKFFGVLRTGRTGPNH